MCVSLSLLGFGDELVGLVPVLKQVGGLFVIHSDVVIFENPWEKVVYFSGDIQDISDPTG